MPRTLNFVIQGYYSGYGWTDLSSYDCGLKRVNYKKAKTACMKDYKEYCFSEQAPHRIIKRYEEVQND